jgi:hypothetical protein
MQAEVSLLEEEYKRMQILQPIPQEFQCYIHEQNELAENKVKVNPYDTSFDSGDLSDSGDAESMVLEG